jgi:hypothetical protein
MKKGTMSRAIVAVLLLLATPSWALMMGEPQNTNIMPVGGGLFVLDSNLPIAPAIPRAVITTGSAPIFTALSKGGYYVGVIRLAGYPAVRNTLIPPPFINVVPGTGIEIIINPAALTALSRAVTAPELERQINSALKTAEWELALRDLSAGLNNDRAAAERLAAQRLSTWRTEDPTTYTEFQNRSAEVNKRLEDYRTAQQAGKIEAEITAILGPVAKLISDMVDLAL